MLFYDLLTKFRAEVFYKNIILAIGAFIAFGIVGYFLIKDASSMGKYLFDINCANYSWDYRDIY